MSSAVTNSKRIAKNTLMLYIRMLLIMAVSLYTSRVVLQTLGVEDFGIYTVVAGVAISFVFFSSSLSNVTQRYLNVELGKGNERKTNEVFNLSLLIYIFFAVLVLLIAFPLGTWLIETKLVIPESRIDAAYWTYYAMVCSLAIVLVSTVFDSVLIARENMTAYAYISIIEAVMKLAIVYILNFVEVDKLKLYGILLFSLNLLIKSSVAIICIRKYPECKFRYYWNTTLFKQMFAFVGWNGFGTAVWMINEQGINILLNIFFGPAVNAARGIAAQVNAAINNFTKNFYTAVRPQIVKSYAAGDFPYFLKLIYCSSRFSFFLIWFLCLPILMRSEYILTLWLQSFPEHTIEFIHWILLYSAVNVMTEPLWNAMQAVGKLKKYIMIGSTVYLMAFPISYVFLKLGFPPILPFQVLVVVRLAYLFVSLLIVRDYIPFSLSTYMNEVIYPVLRVGILSYLLVSYANRYFPQNLVSLIGITFISILIMTSLVWLMGLRKGEKQIVLRRIKSIRKHRE